MYISTSISIPVFHDVYQFFRNCKDGEVWPMQVFIVTANNNTLSLVMMFLNYMKKNPVYIAI